MLLCIFAANRQRVASRINFRLQAEPASFPRLSARAAKLWGVARLAACRSVWIVNAFPFDAETLLAARPKSRRNSAAGRDRSKNFFAHCRVGDALAMNYSGLMPMGGMEASYLLFPDLPSPRHGEDACSMPKKSADRRTGCSALANVIGGTPTRYREVRPNSSKTSTCFLRHQQKLIGGTPTRCREVRPNSSKTSVYFLRWSQRQPSVLLDGRFARNANDSLSSGPPLVAESL